MKNILSKIILFAGKIQWEWVNTRKHGRHFSLTNEDLIKIMEVLNKGNYVICTRRKTHLSTYLANIAHLLLTGRPGYWSHTCMNINDPDEPIQILESVGKGVITSEFMDVFDCDAVWIGRPILQDGMMWEPLISSAVNDLGKKYDPFGNLKLDNLVNCVELLFNALKKDPQHRQRYHGLLAMVKLEGNLTPDFFIECGSFETVLEIRR